MNAEETGQVIEIPARDDREDGSSNVIGELLNAAGVPLCIDERKFNHHIMVAGGSGSGKSNVAANLIEQAVRYGKCVLVHDAKPDYRRIRQANTDPRVRAVWERFEDYRLFAHEATDVRRIGFYGKCDPDAVDEVVGFRASDFWPEMLAGLFFIGSESAEQNGFEAFAAAAYALYEKVQMQQISNYTLDQILEEVRRRCNPQNHLSADETIHEKTGPSILQKVSRRRRSYPWLDSVGQSLRPAPGNRFRGSRLDTSNQRIVGSFNLTNLVASGRILVIDYSEMRDDQSYAVLLSYFLRECQHSRRRRIPAGEEPTPGIVELVDEAHRVFDNRSRHSSTMAAAFERVMREGRSVDHSILLSLQNASQIPPRVMNNLNSKIVMRQNCKSEADAATETMGRDFAAQAMRLGTGHALVSLHESRATVLAQMAPSPYELMRTDSASGTTRPTERATSARLRQNVAPAQSSPVAEQEDDPDDIPF